MTGILYFDLETQKTFDEVGGRHNTRRLGLSVGVTSPTAPPGVLWAQIVGMLLGRLEFFVVIVSAAKLARDTWGMAKPAEGK